MIGRVVGKYRILDQIGEGGMGVVYRAEHVVLGSPAAVKVLLPRLSLDAVVVERLFTEAKATSAIRHVGIVEVFDYGRLDNNQAYIAMELLRGESLAAFLERQPGQRVAPAVAAQITLQMLAALDAAHVVGVVHRDLKPDNIILVGDPGAPGGVRVKLLDFGIAKLVGNHRAPRPKTKGGAILGTPAYMAPEQCKGGVEVDARADLYAVGCILFELLTGRPPFVSEGDGAVLAMHIYEPPPRLTALDRALPVELDALLAKMLTKVPADRTPSAAFALAALERIQLAPARPITIRTPDPLYSVALPGAPEASRLLPLAVLFVAVVIAAVAVVAIGITGTALPR